MRPIAWLVFLACADGVTAGEVERAPSPPATLEDLYGDSGNSFQGALGYWVQEGTTGSQPFAGYGVGVDDMVIEWKEVSRVKDATSCATGSCATVSLAVTNVFEGSGTLVVTVLDPTPWDANAKNDCNGDGDYLDATDDTDCDNDGVDDVLVRAISDAEPAGELVALDRVAPGALRWRAEIPYQSSIDLAGILFVKPLTIGGGTARATVRYEDRDDGSGQRCRNDANPSLQGFVEDGTDIRFDAARITVKSVRLTDNGDDDGFADPNETVNAFVTLRNTSGRDQDALVVRIASNDPNVDCVLDSVAAFGPLAAGETRESTTPVTFRVANVSRSSVAADLTATLDVAVAGDDFDVLTHAQQVVLDLDLDVSGGFVPTSFTEGFEDMTFGTFTTMTLDVGKASNTLSDGLRCQYNDPSRTSCGSDCGNIWCYVGGATAAVNAFDWHVHGTSAPDGGRAYLGTQSLHWGVHPGAAGMDTTRLKQLDAIRTTDPVNLGWNGVTPELSFKHQVGLTDCDYVNCVGSMAADRGVVHVQLANSAGAGVGIWRKVYPYQNLYDSQGVDNYTNCTFDPTDDGNTEDSYFDPTDPNRRLGPSSTCMPEFTFSRLGAISHTAAFDPHDVHHASDGPGLQGSLGPGTWVESKFSLARWRGRRLRLRLLATSIEVANAATMQQALVWNPIEADDGWYIDDVQVTNTLVAPATVAVDTADRTGLPGCGLLCGSVTAALSASPSTTEAPGRLVRLDASPSFADRCVDGLLQFRFWRGAVGDVLLRTWTDNPILLEAPDLPTSYVVEVRCSSLPSCTGSTTFPVGVTCPSSGSALVPFSQTIGFSSKTDLGWGSAARVDVIRGDLDALRASDGQFDGTVEACLADDFAGTSWADATAPASGAGKYYLVRGAGPAPYCNAGHSFRTASGAERPGVGGDRDADLALDPGSCPQVPP